MSKRDVRDGLISALYDELIGPKEGENESFIDLPTNRYILGILFPKETEIGEAYIEGETEGDVDGGDDEVNIMSAKDRVRPSSMGISVLLDKAVDEVLINVSYAVYHAKADTSAPKGARFERSEQQWSDHIGPKSGPARSFPVGKGIRASVICKTYPMDSGNNVLSVFLVNDEDTAKDARELSARCLYSPRIEIVSKENGILARERSRSDVVEEDLRSLNLLYHDRHEFGAGHGCSVEWGLEDGPRCGVVRSTFMPQYHQQPLAFKESEFDLDMLEMSKRDRKQQTLAQLQGLIVNPLLCIVLLTADKMLAS